MREVLHRRVAAYLREHHVMTLATHGSEGVWAAAVFYVSDGFNLIFLSSPSSRHCRNLAESPRVSATVQEDYADWPEIKGVQLEGIAREIGGEREQHARHIYGEKFPLIRGLAQAPVAIAKAMDKVRWYEVVTDRLYFIDNSAGFGHRDAIELPRRG
ncbi:MAG: pyridoxamine 5'-phosphate oxidase family protein [Betaproteobacteria bacterium]|nr:pyridoxamine 5'-phosphate oxidase family protein [Betaproteobacteria bacterium]